MLFHSPEFLLWFLPGVLALYLTALRIGRLRVVLGVLLVGSLFFYAWWNPAYLAVLLASIAGNYLLAGALGRATGDRWRRGLLAVGCLANLAVLGYFKYTGFFLANLGAAIDAAWSPISVTLPLAISFFTFQQIGFLVDTYRRRSQPYSPLEYGLFVTFFPQLVAGPIVRHDELLPQLARFRHPSIGTAVRSRDVAIGCTLFVIGLFKKVVLADWFAFPAALAFRAVDTGAPLTALLAWQGVLGYTLQLYFDFSGYCDMALGLARLFGIVLPINFDAPYQAVNLIDFWRRWHATLSRFLRDYLYIPLGGSRGSRLAHHRNIFLTMLLCGVWHGAGWNFIVWGALQGLLLNVNVAWRSFRGSVLQNLSAPPTALGSFVARLLTFTSFVLGLVVFRSATPSGSARMFRVLFQLGTDASATPPAAPPSHLWSSLVLPDVHTLLPGAELLLSDQALVSFAVGIGLIVCWSAPSSTAIAGAMDSGRMEPRRLSLLAVWVGLLAFVCSLWLIDPLPTPFIYYQF